MANSLFFIPRPTWRVFLYLSSPHVAHIPHLTRAIWWTTRAMVGRYFSQNAPTWRVFLYLSSPHVARITRYTASLLLLVGLHLLGVNLLVKRTQARFIGYQLS